MIQKIGLGVMLFFRFTGCATVHHPAWIQSTLYFDMGLSDGETISPDLWQNFVKNEITPRFPDGLTICPAQGQWKDDAGVVSKEQSQMVILLHPDTDTSEVKLEKKRRVYKRAFQQKSVLLVTESVKVSF